MNLQNSVIRSLGAVGENTNSGVSSKKGFGLKTNNGELGIDSEFVRKTKALLMPVFMKQAF